MDKEKLLPYEVWLEKNKDDLVEKYEFDLHEALNDFSLDQAEAVSTFKDYCVSLYLSYVDDFIN